MGVLCRPVRRFIAEVQLLDSKPTSAPGSQALGSITAQDIKEALLASKPSAALHEVKYKAFGEQHGQAAS